MLETDYSTGNDYWSRVRRRSKTEQGVPWFLARKLESIDFYRREGFPHPELLATFGDVTLESFRGLPDSFVFKPTFASTNAGVYVLDRMDENSFFDRVSNKTLSIEPILEVSRQLLKEFGRDTSATNFLVEEVVEDINGLAVPPDYKVFAFYGKAGLVFRSDKNVQPAALTFWDGEGRRLRRGAVTVDKHASAILVDEEPPAFIQEVIKVAEAFSARVPVPMMRVDLYMSTKGPLLGEITLLPGTFYYENRDILSAGMSAYLGNIWLDAEKRIAEDYGRYPLLQGEMTKEDFYLLRKQRANNRLRAQ